MNKDRIEGSARQVKGAVKEAAGKGLGDAKLVSEGDADKAAGDRHGTVRRHVEDSVAAQELDSHRLTVPSRPSPPRRMDRSTRRRRR